MNIEILLTPHIWLQVRPDVRVALAKEFGTQRSTSPRCITEGGITRVESDGFTIQDLRVFGVESMQKWLGFVNIDVDADLHALFGMCVDMMEKKMGLRVAEQEIASSSLVVEETKPRFCEFCDSKGVKHKLTCTRKV